MNAPNGEILRLFRLLCGIGLLARFSYALARNPVLPLFALALGAGPEGIGLAVGISTVTGIFFKLPSGALSDVIGRRRTMLAGLVVFGCMPFAYLLVSSYQGLVVVRFLHGLATAIYGPVAMAVVADVAGQRKGEMLSWFSSLAILGTLLGAPVGGFLLFMLSGGNNPTLFDFRIVYLASGIAGATALVLGLRTLRNGERPPRAGTLKQRWHLFRRGIAEVVSDRRVLVTSSMEGVQNMSMGALEAFLPIYAVTVVGLNEFQAGMLWGAQVVVTLIAKPLMGRVSDRWGRRPLIVAGLFLCAVPFMLIPHLTTFSSLLLACALFGFGEAFVTSSSAALVADYCHARNYGAAMGTFGTIFDIGHASGPIVTGLLIAALGYGTAFAIVGTLLIAAVPVFLTYVREEPSPF
ncbi:MFS transporter [Desulfovibrio psychrotolerans]|uniref:MFS transporter n=1 Tax=Desulfovibrio psychrotolerans TaxID=415242 RepID=A0A7J0BQJ9_9BACT|nr:MFS transporter [Desulfovibrio psychrotolerans]GFM35950.1 MFS transporter [Desulfovibrio psychrotolerans]